VKIRLSADNIIGPIYRLIFVFTLNVLVYVNNFACSALVFLAVICISDLVLIVNLDLNAYH